MSDDQAIEQDVREQLSRGTAEDIQRGVELAMGHYGQRLCAFVLNIVRDPAVAADVQQDVWLSVFVHAPKFRWESSLKGWLYLLARRAAIKATRKDHQHHKVVGTPLSQAAESKLRAHLMTSVAEWQKDDFKAKFRELRRKLPEKDQTLLVMRADQELPFRDIVHALAEPDEALTVAELKTRETTLMKRFQRVKQRLYQLALEEGLLAPGDDT